MSILKTTILQAKLEWHKPDENFHHFDTLFDSIKNRDLVVLPEMWSTGFTMKAHLFHSYADQALDLMKKWSIQSSACVAGSVIAREGDDDYNRLYIVKDGKLLDHYDKRHLFAYSGEDRSFKAGSEKKIVNIGGFELCFNICYDLRFPVWARNYEDYDVLIYSANWPDKRKLAWSSLLRARAIENQAYVLGVNCVGSDAWHNSYAGNSMAVSFDGQLCQEIPAGEQIVHVDLNKEVLLKFREEFPFLSDRDPVSSID